MCQLWYNTPTRIFLQFTGSYEDCKKYAENNMDKLYCWGYFFVIRLTNNFIAIKKIGSQLYS